MLACVGTVAELLQATTRLGAAACDWFLRAGLVIGVVGFAGAVGSVSCAAAAAMQRGACVQRWHEVRGPGGVRSGSFSAVAASASGDAWFLGRSYRAQVLAHWRDGRWTTVNLPRDEALADVSALSAADVWAVGGVGASALVEHWDGSRWDRLNLPRSVARGRSLAGLPTARLLTAVSAASPNDVWAVGEDYNKKLSAWVVLHWNGASWSVVATTPLELTAVAALSSSDVWVTTRDAFSLTPTRRVQLLHWDGRHWRHFTLRGPLGSDTLGLSAVTAVSARDVWVVGWDDPTPWGHLTGENWGLIFRWDGRRWQRRQPIFSSSDSFDAVAVRSPSEAWIVDNDVSGFEPQPGSWLFTGEHPNRSTTHLPQGYVIAALAATQASVWAVGWVGTGRANENDYTYAKYRPLIERFGC
jgi:hypothetical protein